MFRRCTAFFVSAGLLMPAFAFAASDVIMPSDMQSSAMMKSDTMMKSDAMMEKHMMKKANTMMRKEARMKRHMMKKDAMMKKNNDGTMMKKKKDSMMEKNKDEGMMKPAVMRGAYKDMTFADLPASILTNGKTKVLFFHASWCPSCKAADQTLTSWYSDGKGLLIVYKINYDNEKTLKQKYGVTYQHTFVKIDGKGNMIKILMGPSDEDLKNLLRE